MGLSTIKLTGKSKARAQEFSELVKNNLIPLDCFLCGSPNEKIDVFSEEDRYGFIYPTGICLHCGNIQQAEYYNDEHVKIFYEMFYRDIYGGLSPSDLFDHQYRRGKDVYEFCEDHVKDIDKTVLEIGTGSGGILARFRDAGFQTRGFDLDDRYMTFARKKGLSVHFGNIESIGTEEDDFGLIIVCHVLEHIVDPKEFLSTAVQNLSDDGFLFVEVPVLDGVLKGDYRGLIGRYLQNAHVVHFSTKTLINMLEQVGLRVLKADEFGRVLAVKTNIDEVASPSTLLRSQTALLDDLLSAQRNHIRKKPLKSLIYFVYDLVKPLFKK